MDRRRHLATALVLAIAVVVPVACAGPPLAAGEVGRLVFPVAGRVSYSDTFGAPRAGGRTHEGQDLMAAKGTPLVATTDGTVTWLRWGTTTISGNMLILTGDNGWKHYYIHINNDSPGTDDGANVYEQAFADGVRVGQRVKAGEVIAYVGDSGDAETTAPHLHYELHRPDGSVVNAFGDLRAATRTQRTEAERIADSPTGALEAVDRVAGGGLRIRGWALDAVRNDPVKASVYVNGNPVATVDANVSRPDVAAAHPGRGDRHGVDIAAQLGSGSTVIPVGARVCLIAHSVGGGGSTRVGCLTAPA
ncbi:MAG: M23 family metallopeptidase [Microthrixaceae bacterium]